MSANKPTARTNKKTKERVVASKPNEEQEIVYPTRSELEKIAEEVYKEHAEAFKILAKY